MRIIEWNCNMAFRKKASKILALEPDLLIVPECECPERLIFSSSAPQPKHEIWIGDNPTKGIGVFSYNADLKPRLHKLYDPKLRYVVPIEVIGDVNFNLLAIWAMNDKENRRQRYIGQVWLAVNRYKTLLSGSILIAGDFNWNKIWDHSRHLYGNLTQTVEFLSARGIKSLYHTFSQEAFGQETQPTLYMYRKADKPYHVDYIFGSADLRNCLQSFEVGTYSNWQKQSDHMPIIATFEGQLGQ
jgi:exodeoxyribonuclease-3